MRREFELQTQAPEESLFEYIPAMQELYEYANPKSSIAERGERVVRQSHPTFAPYVRGCSCPDLNDLLSYEARKLQAAIAASPDLHRKNRSNPFAPGT